ncbi:(E2-independent) E3 ubiquitin-conjugating enzyme FATS isoform X2 [Girardinichthys multiradiatus]|uniref:(E2-independent) E3 ubiquitin-conjugating enzyme FATS isoform X2 n=1 Tax=Girardinichthys multiradiatus TaxID=208333 RepID=UPI001FAE5A47|nr:(E2-independent) E3 ubiquitin-conjugating enzyme FATS isoform X2 [Girardinichthys multiradiatus]
MTLRRPAAHPRGARDWRRSGDESSLGSFVSQEETLPRSSDFSCAPRPQSAIEGGQLDIWLEYLRTMPSKVRSPIHNPSFDNRTASEGQTPGRAWRQTDFSSSTASSSCGSSPSSQESLQTMWFPSPEHRRAWEKAHIMQSPSKEQAQLSCLAPVKIGWLPIQRRAMLVGNACSQKQHLNTSSGQVKLKQPITPAVQKNDDTDCYKAEAERSLTSPSAPGVKTQRTLDQDSAVKGPDKLNSAAKELKRSVGWHALRTGWKPKRTSGPPGSNNSNELGKQTDLEPNEKPYLLTTTSTVHVKHLTASADPSGDRSLLRGANTTNIQKPHTPLQRTSSVQPLKATVFYGTNTLESSHVQTSSTATTLIPQNKAGFSSITISSRKVSRSASFPGSRTNKSPSPPPADLQPMDPNSRQVRVQRKATIVKVTEQRVISSSASSTSRLGTPPSGNDLDTVVHRRKAAIIKVTEQKESYSPGKITHRNPEYRHSYTEGLYKNNSTLSQENQLENTTFPAYHLNSSPGTATDPNTFSSNIKKNTLHRSTLNLFLRDPPAIASPPLEPPPRADGQRFKRPQRPLSCYGSLSGDSKQSKESVAPLSNWKLESSGLPRDTPINYLDFNRLFISSGKTAKEAGQPMATDRLTPNRDEKERLPLSVDGTRRASPSLTLIKAPDPDSHQSQEEVLALNAAAIIANIKLQRQLSKKEKTPSGESERDSTASPQGNAVTDERKDINSKKSEAQHHKQPYTEFIPLIVDHERSSKATSLQRALERSRPEFISRSQERVRVLDHKVQERRRRLAAGKLERRGDQLRQLRAHSSTGSTSVNGNLIRPTN